VVWRETAQERALWWTATNGAVAFMESWTVTNPKQWTSSLRSKDFFSIFWTVSFTGKVSFVLMPNFKRLKILAVHQMCLRKSFTLSNVQLLSTFICYNFTWIWHFGFLLH
jgi:hypothetical protein